MVLCSAGRHTTTAGPVTHGARHLNAAPVRESLVAANQAERKATKVLDRLADAVQDDATGLAT